MSLGRWERIQRRGEEVADVRLGQGRYGGRSGLGPHDRRISGRRQLNAAGRVGDDCPPDAARLRVGEKDDQGLTG